MIDPQQFEDLRPRLKRLAYRMLGSWAEAEDAVQDTYLRLAEHQSIGNLEAITRTTLARLCLDRLRSARHRREAYPGQWLPEPVADAQLYPEGEPGWRLEHKDSLAYGLLVLLEKLKPEERIVFVLREALHLSHREVAEVLGKAEASCRQILVKARRHLSQIDSSPKPVDEPLVDRFLQALQLRDIAALQQLFAPNVVSISDGGGKAVTALLPLHGLAKVMAFLVGVNKKLPESLDWRRINSNGESTLLFYVDGKLDTVFLVRPGEGGIDRLFILRNPDKFGGLSQNVAPPDREPPVPQTPAL